MASIRTHTTLRTLFAATAVFAFLAATWMYFPHEHLLLVVLTSCAVGFVAGLFGFSLVVAILLSLTAAAAVVTIFVARSPEYVPTPAWATRLAVDNASVALST